LKLRIDSLKLFSAEGATLLATLTAGALVYVSSPAGAQSPSCDSAQGSGACLPWGLSELDLPGEIFGLSADGSVVVGALPSLEGTFRWKMGEPVEVMSYPSSYSDAPNAARQNVSANGAIVVGDLRLLGEVAPRIFRWDADDDLVTLLPSGPAPEASRFFPFTGVTVLPTSRASVSGDGDVIVGRGDAIVPAGTLSLSWPFRWTPAAGTSDDLQAPFNDPFDPYSVAGGGSDVVGRLDLDGFPSELAARWHSGAGEVLLFTKSEATAVSYDGEVVAGIRLSQPSFRWESGAGFQDLGEHLQPRSISDDGSIITSLNFSPPSPFCCFEPWLWDAVNGDRWLLQALVDDYGISAIAGFTRGALYSYGLVSGDGTVFSVVGSKEIAKVSPISFVSLGDSFSSGEGVPPYATGTDVPGQNLCHRSLNAYSTMVTPRTSTRSLQDFASPPSAIPGFTWDFIACSGATTNNVLSSGTGQFPGTPDTDPQLARGLVNADTDLVTITIGGNDAFFADVAVDCGQKFNCFNREALVHRRRYSIKHPAMRPDDGPGGPGPFERRGVSVPSAQIGSEMIAQSLLRAEIGQEEGLLGQDPEPSLDLIEPGCARRGVVKMDARMVAEPFLHVGRSVRRGVVQDHVELLLGVGPHHLVHEGDEVGTGVALAEPMRDVPGRHVQGGIQIDDAVALVVMRVADRTTRSKGERPLRALQRLNRRLLVHTQHHGVLGRMQVQADDVVDLGLELGIPTHLVGSHAMGLEALASQDIRDRTTRDSHRLAQQPRRPARAARRRGREGELHDLLDRLLGQRVILAPRLGPLRQALDPSVQEAAPNPRHGFGRHIQPPRDLTRGDSVCRPQHHERAAGDPSRLRPSRRNRLQGSPLSPVQSNRVHVSHEVGPMNAGGGAMSILDSISRAMH